MRSRRYRQRAALSMFTAIGMIWLTGCGEDGPPPAERAVTFGIVHFEGQPVEDGNIRFIHEHAQMAAGPIRDGKYRIEFKGGVPVGTVKVEIDAYRRAGEDYIISADGKRQENTEQFIPPKYNTQSELRREIVGGKENELDFDLYR